MDKDANITDKDEAQKYRQERVSEHAVPDVNIAKNVGFRSSFYLLSLWTTGTVN